MMELAAQSSARKPAWSLRRLLLTGILLPVLALIALNAWSLYEQTLSSLHTAYDRTLLASAKSISEQIGVVGYDDQAVLHAIVPYSALEIFEADNQSRMFYRVSTLDGKLISGFDELPMWHGRIPQRPPYAALVDFYDAEFRDHPVRVAVLLQPVASSTGRGMAVIQVAETLELRESLALQILRDTLIRQALLVLVVALIVIIVVQRATQPIRQLSHDLQGRAQGDLSPLDASEAPREIQPLLDATNHTMQRLSRLLNDQKRFVRDASHQLRTPLAVLKVQVQSAKRGDIPPALAFEEIDDTVDRATRLANQMLALAKVEQLRQEDTAQPEEIITAFDEVVRDVALELSPLIAEHDMDFGIETEACPVPAHEWMLRELTRNLLHNAIRHTPHRGHLLISVKPEQGQALLCIEDSGGGIDEELAQRLFQPFSAGNARSGSGLGLAICQEIVQTLGGQITLRNQHDVRGKVRGLQARVLLPMKPVSSDQPLSDTHLDG
ncbi:MAG: sensor histidine kinase [Comamonas sp.]|jgi:two-component system sensor histidine kinase TctE|nr:sensor histidine kinase [Comamonas sp.]MDR0215338.1 sensor histidine kinase [Comamonas sp.]